ncbi:MAG: agmatinase [Thermoproteota archaeon]
MEKTLLHITEPYLFAGFRKPFEKARYAIFGVPFDGTVSYRPGQRFAPNSIREYSAQLETMSLRFGVDLEDVYFTDIGDVGITLDLDGTLKNVRETVKDLVGSGKIPVCMGGEHTITMGVLQGTGRASLLVFDAHLDLRGAFMGLKLSHASWLRNTIEAALADKVLVVGARGFCKEEIEYASNKVEYITPLDLRNDKGKESFTSFVEDAGRLYISIDFDVFDPAYAPGVGNPEPDGLSTSEVYSLLELITSRNLIGFDVVEVSPPYDLGVTSSLAAKTLFELISLSERNSRA